jgi:predicted AAA+ superfamily ATPase
VFLRNTLLEILRDQHPPATPDPEVARRLAQRLPKRSVQALVLTGVRRCGKSTLQAQLRPRDRGTFYCNLEDTRLFGLQPEDLPGVLSVIDELADANATINLDEVQELPEWQRLVRALLDRGRALCLTGSNASLLGRELGAKLTGRHLSFEVLPFDYPEYLSFTSGRPGAASLAAYLDDGGFPAYLRERAPQILQELLRDIVQRDIAQRHRLRETRHVMNLALFLLANTGQPLSLQGLTKALAVPTVGQTSRYLEYLQDAYLLFAVPKFSASFKQRVVTPNKYYAIDNGLRRVNSPQATSDRGHRLENAVYLALRSRYRSICYAGEKDSWECDFVTDDLAIQVCHELTPQNRDREIGGVLQAAALPGKRGALILTSNQRDRLTVAGRVVEIVPAWSWLNETPASA